MPPPSPPSSPAVTEMRVPMSESSMADQLVTSMANMAAVVLTATRQSHEPPALRLGSVAPEALVCDSMCGLALR